MIKKDGAMHADEDLNAASGGVVEVGNKKFKKTGFLGLGKGKVVDDFVVRSNATGADLGHFSSLEEAQKYDKKVHGSTSSYNLGTTQAVEQYDKWSKNN